MVYLYRTPLNLRSGFAPEQDRTQPGASSATVGPKTPKRRAWSAGPPTQRARGREEAQPHARSGAVRTADGRTWRARRRGAGWRGRDDVDRPAARKQPNDPCSLNATGTWVAKLCIYGIFLRPQEKPRAQAQVHTRPIRGSRPDVICQVYCRSVRWLILWEPSVHILGVLLKKKGV